MASFTSRGKNNNNSTIALSGLVMLALSACGGGGSGQPSTQSTVTTTTSSVTRTAVDAQPIAVRADNAGGKAAQNNGAFRSAAPAPLKPYTVTINGHTHAGGKKIVLDDFALSALNSVPTANGGNIRAYRQKHSIIAGYLGPKRKIAKDDNGKDIILQDPMRIGLVTGDITQTLPETGKYTYTGQAFNDSGTGRLNYQVDFNSGKGSGSVTGIEETGKITLKEADIKNVVQLNTLGDRAVGKGIEGSVQTEKKGHGDYTLTFFGPNAEEIGGMIYHSGGEIGIGGSRK